MKVNDELYVLELPMNFGGVERIMKLSLIVDKQHGLTHQDMDHVGSLHPAKERTGATPDMAKAVESVKKLAGYDVETIVCYHGGVVTDDANAQLKRCARI